jgi:capsular polysaccharide biosynthesis protein
MELNEAARRIVGQHWSLIVLLVAVCVSLVAVQQRGDVKTYTASTRFVLDTQDPQSRAEAAAIADTAKAIATSPSQVEQALRKARVRNRDAVEVAKHDVSVRGLGSSGILQLSVSDASPPVAAAVSNALAAELIQTRLNVTRGQAEQALTVLEQRIDNLTRKISGLDAYIDSLNLAVATARTAERANVLRSRRNSAERSRDFLAQRRGVLESERVSLLSTDALRPKPSIISRANLPEHADSSHRAQDLVLGGLFGLVFGLGLAGLIETFRPTLVGGDALANELDTPLLGTLPSDAEEAWLATNSVGARLRLAAEAARLPNVGLLAIGPDTDLGNLAERLEEASAGARIGAVHHGQPGFRVGPFDLHNPSLNGGGTGLVLVSPTKLKKADFAEISHLLRVTPVPLLGLITYTNRRSLLVGGPARDEV